MDGWMTALQQWPRYSDPTLADVLGQIQIWECVKGCVHTTDPCGPELIWLLNGSVTNKMESHLFKSDLSHFHICSQNQVQIWWNDLSLIGNVTHIGNQRDFYITSVRSWESQIKTLWLQLIHSRQDPTTPGCDSASTHSSAQKKQPSFHREPRLHHTFSFSFS